MIARIDSWICEFIRGNRHAIEAGKLLTIGLLALLSLFVSAYFLYFSPYAGFRFVYVFIPHLYLIPIILLALWYPKSGIRLVILIMICLFTFWAFADFFGFTFPPLFVILYTGIDLAAFVVFLLYVKDRRLVEAVIMEIMERNKNRGMEKPEGKNRFKGDFDEIVTALYSPDESLREDAVSALSELGDERAIFPLITALRDDNAYIRRGAVQALGDTNSSKVIKPLIKSLTDEDRYVREAASESLGHLGTLAIPDLIRELQNPDWRIRMGCVIAMRLASEQPDTDPVIRMLTDKSTYVRREAVKTLARIGDVRILPYLIDATRDPDAGVRLRAVRGVARVGSGDEMVRVLQRCMQDPDNSVRIRAEEEMINKRGAKESLEDN